MSNKMSAETESLLAGARDVEVLRHKLRLLNIEAQHRVAWYHSHYNPNQPRVPAGDPRGGEWTREGGVPGMRLAANDTRGPGSWLAILLHFGMLAIEAYRSKHGLWDLFRSKVGTVTWMKFNGKDFFGSNSKSYTYTDVDYAAAVAMRSILLQKYPESIKSDNIGQMPANAVFHAEVTILLRAARENRGTLAGLTLEVVGDGRLCNNCETILPKIGLELGNPTVTFIERTGRTWTMRDGKWQP
jgi:hypothetical protein